MEKRSTAFPLLAAGSTLTDTGWEVGHLLPSDELPRDAGPIGDRSLDDIVARGNFHQFQPSIGIIGSRGDQMIVLSANQQDDDHRWTHFTTTKLPGATSADISALPQDVRDTAASMFETLAAQAGVRGISPQFRDQLDGRIPENAPVPPRDEIATVDHLIADITAKDASRFYRDKVLSSARQGKFADVARAEGLEKVNREAGAARMPVPRESPPDEHLTGVSRADLLNTHNQARLDDSRTLQHNPQHKEVDSFAALVLGSSNTRRER